MGLVRTLWLARKLGAMRVEIKCEWTQEMIEQMLTEQLHGQGLMTKKPEMQPAADGKKRRKRPSGNGFVWSRGLNGVGISVTATAETTTTLSSKVEEPTFDVSDQKAQDDSRARELVDISKKR